MTSSTAVKALYSIEDRSVNFVSLGGQEARYVRRTDDYAIVYLSSHNGCDKACRFCHLTQTGQTQMVEATVEDFVTQATQVLGHYRRIVASGMEKPVNRIHFNWMARGEPLDSHTLRDNWREIRNALVALANVAGVHDTQFNISTIFPVEAGNPLAEFYRVPPSERPTLYYSLYSVNPKFRRRWLPKAALPSEAMHHLVEYQRRLGNVVLHWAFIKGENDSAQDVMQCMALVERHNLHTRFNLVRYNPYGPYQGEESDDDTLKARIKEIMPYMKVPGSRIVSRVGRDVAASCGMFVRTRDEFAGIDATSHPWP